MPDNEPDFNSSSHQDFDSEDVNFREQHNDDYSGTLHQDDNNPGEEPYQSSPASNPEPIDEESLAIQTMPRFKKKPVSKEATPEIRNEYASNDNEAENGAVNRDTRSISRTPSIDSESSDTGYDQKKSTSVYQAFRSRPPTKTTNAKKNRKQRGSLSPEPENEERPKDPKALEIEQLHQEMDRALKSGNLSRRKKRNEMDTDIDEGIQLLQERMRIASDADYEDNKKKLPAIHKIELLPEAIQLLGKPHLYEPLLENNFLDTLRLWLEPLDDGSLPNIDIQRELLGAIDRMPIRIDHLRESGIGKIILFMSKCQRYPERHRRLADQLVQKWARPILKRSANFSDAVVHNKFNDGYDRVDSSRGPGGARPNAPNANRGFSGRVQVQAGEAIGVHSFHASIPYRDSRNYNIVPKSSLNMNSIDSSKSMPEKFKRIRSVITKSVKK